MLTTCPSATKKLIQKQNWSKDDVANNDSIIDQQNHHSASVTFSDEFVKHYFGNSFRIFLEYNLEISQSKPLKYFRERKQNTSKFQRTSSTKRITSQPDKRRS